MTLEELLNTKVVDDNKIEFTPDFRVSVQNETEEGIHIIIHPYGYNGETLDFYVKGNTLTEIK